MCQRITLIKSQPPFMYNYFCLLCLLQHEDASVQMFRHLLQHNNLDEVFREHGLTEPDIVFIEEQIVGPRNSSSTVSSIFKRSYIWRKKTSLSFIFEGDSSNLSVHTIQLVFKQYTVRNGWRAIRKHTPSALTRYVAVLQSFIVFDRKLP